MDRGALQGGNKVRHSWLPGKPVVVHREATCKWLKGREELWWGDPCKWADSDCCWQGTLGIVRCASSSGSHLAPVWHVTVIGTAVGLRSCWGRPDVLGEVQASFLWQTPDTKVMLARLAFAEIYFWPVQGRLLWLECVAKCITKYLGKESRCAPEHKFLKLLQPHPSRVQLCKWNLFVCYWLLEHAASILVGYVFIYLSCSYIDLYVYTWIPFPSIVSFQSLRV